MSVFHIFDSVILLVLLTNKNLYTTILLGGIDVRIFQHNAKKVLCDSSS